MPTSNGRFSAKNRSRKTPRSTPTRRPKAKSSSASALRILDRITGSDAALRDLIQQETINVHVARLIHDVRTRAGLTQAELAQRIGTKQPVIARLEDADYDGHRLTMLQRIADALGFALNIRFVAKNQTKASIT